MDRTDLGIKVPHYIKRTLKNPEIFSFSQGVSMYYFNLQSQVNEDEALLF